VNAFFFTGFEQILQAFAASNVRGMAIMVEEEERKDFILLLKT
jgi:hypothetical protein